MRAPATPPLARLIGDRFLGPVAEEPGKNPFHFKSKEVNDPGLYLGISELQGNTNSNWTSAEKQGRVVACHGALVPTLDAEQHAGPRRGAAAHHTASRQREGSAGRPSSTPG
eukprot:scaffold84698_cov44-Phaeocystis_antarctica.AAC.4